MNRNYVASTSSLYFSIENEPNTCLFTLTYPQLFNHCNLYGLGCFQQVNLAFQPKQCQLHQCNYHYQQSHCIFYYYLTPCVKYVIALHFILIFHTHIQCTSCYKQLSINKVFHVIIVIFSWRHRLIIIFTLSFNITILSQNHCALIRVL